MPIIAYLLLASIAAVWKSCQVGFAAGSFAKEIWKLNSTQLTNETCFLLALYHWLQLLYCYFLALLSTKWPENSSILTKWDIWDFSTISCVLGILPDEITNIKEEDQVKLFIDATIFATSLFMRIRALNTRFSITWTHYWYILMSFSLAFHTGILLSCCKRSSCNIALRTMWKEESKLGRWK